jgi:Ca-activated chloride channel family protein
MTFGHIHLLYLLLLVPIAVVAYAFDGQRRRRALERIGHLPMLLRMTASSSPARRRWRAILTVAAVACLCAALARPQLPGRAKLTQSRGLDLVVALDFSRSMLAKDVYPTRLDRAKRELDHLIDSLKGDRVGLVAFAGETMAYPLTIDYEAAKLFWRDLGPDDMPVGGTDLGRAIRSSTELLVRGKKESDKRKGAQVILLLTDGEDTEGQGVAAARDAAALGIRIYTLGIGSAERPFVQLTDAEGKSTGYLSGSDGEPVRVGLDEAALRQIATAAGGEYVTLDPRRFGVERVQSAIAGLERTQEAARFEREPEDVGRFFLLPAFILLLLEASVRERKRVAKKIAEESAPRTVDPRSGRTVDVQRAALIFLMLFPFVTGFDLFQRRDPNIEEGNKALAAGKADKALEAYDRAAGTMPEDPVVRFDRGAALYQLGKFPEAQKEFLRATESRDQSLRADSYYNMGNALMKQERFKDALDAYKHTLTLRPEDRRAKWNLELALRKMRQEQQKQQQQQQNQDQKDQKDQKDQSQQQQSQQQQSEQQHKDQQSQQQKEQQQQQKEQQQKEQQAKQEQQQKQPEKPNDSKEKQAAQANKEAPREIDKQDAEAVLDALERVEPTVQKELARRRAGSRRPTKDW